MSSQATLNPAAEAAEKKGKGALLDEQPLGERIRPVRERVEGLYARGKDRVLVWEDDVEGYVRERPLKSLAIATGVGAGLGLILGLVLTRR